MAAKAFPWKNKVMNPAQIGGIETAVQDNGLARGVRIAWINTGTGLRYKVVIDRGMDIVEAFYNEHSLAFLTHNGVQRPRPDATAGLEWLWTWPGGLVTTCGLQHMGAPVDAGEFDKRGLHGRVSSLPAEIESVVQPDPTSGKLEFSITGVIRESKMFGPNVELRRTISGRLGEAKIQLDDEVMNRGSAAADHMMLYHINFGWPIVDEGVDILWKGRHTSVGREMDDALWNSRHNFRKCPPPMDLHRGSGESCAVIDVKADRRGVCMVGLYNPKLKLAVQIQYDKKQLPYLTNWQHWGFGDYVTGIEPCSHPPLPLGGDTKLRKPIRLRSGARRRYSLAIDVLSDKGQVAAFRKKAAGS